MGRRLNVSTPTVINTELVPLDESFYLDVDGQMEQWYYDNTEQYAPNRKIIPLLIVPVISAFDKDTSTSYTPAFNTTQWFAKEWNGTQGKYVETAITNQVDSGSADYVIQGNNLLVKKNVSYSHAVSIRCVATYIDPRDRGVTYAVEDSVNLTTNRTADVVFPEVDIISPSGRAYNPLVDDENSQYDFKGVTTNNPVQPLNTDVRRYSVDVDGTEEILNSGEAVAPIMDIRYGNNPTMEDQEFMYRQTADGELVGDSIDKAFIERIKGNTVAWNQMVRNGNFANGVNGWNVYSGTGSVSDNVLTVTNAVGRNGVKALSSYALQLVSSHKYYYSFRCKTSVELCFYLVVNDVKVQPNSSLELISGISTPKRSGDICDFFPNISGETGTFSLADIMVFDLTLIFGAGNEPTTVAQFEADYERWFGKPLSYEEYDEGSLRPVLMNAIQTKGANNSWTKTRTMPITTLKGRLEGAGESVTIFPDGLKKAGNIQDEIFVEGGVVKAIKRVGSVDLGSLGFGLYQQVFYHTFGVGHNKSNKNLICALYKTLSTGNIAQREDKAIWWQSSDDCTLVVQDSTYSSASTFQAAMQGVMLYYELETPETYVLDPITDLVWYGIKNGQEVLANTLPWYVSGQGTDNLVVDAMYGENINVVLRCKMMDGETLSPSKAYATLSWRTPDIETFVQSDNGGAVRSNTEDMTFDTIVNVNGDVLSDSLKQKHLAFNWKIRKNNTSTEIDKGWGQQITIDASELRNVTGMDSTLASTLVGNVVYLKGAYEEVTDGGEVVTYNGEKVYGRPVD